MKITFNPTWTKEEVNEFLVTIKNNGGFCPCSIIKDKDHKCMCKEFMETDEGTCHCGLYTKVKE